MATTLGQNQIPESEATLSKPDSKGLAAPTPLKPRLGKGSLRFSPYGKSLEGERNILVGERRVKRFFHGILESESLGETVACSEKNDRVKMSSAEERGKEGAVKGNQVREVGDRLRQNSDKVEKYLLKEQRLSEELNRIFNEKVIEVFSKDLKALEISNL